MINLKEQLQKKLKIPEALEVYEGCVRCFETNVFADKELHAKSLIALGSVILFANDLINIH